MQVVDARALEFAVNLAKPVVEHSLSVAPGQTVPIPPRLSKELNAMLSSAMLDELLALRERERSVSF